MKIKKEGFRLTALAAAMLVVLPCLAETTTIESVVTSTVDYSDYDTATITTSDVGIKSEAGTDVVVTANNLNINSTKGVVANNASSKVRIDAAEVNIDASGTGIYSRVGGQTEINADTLNIGGGNFGIMVQNNTDTDPAPDGAASVNIRANSTTITATQGGIAAFSNGQVNISGDLTIDAPIAIGSRGNSTVNINQDGQGKVVLNGDIAFLTPGSANQSGNIIDAAVNLNLTGADSSWTGNVKRDYPSGNEGNAGFTQVNGGVTLNLANGAQWNPTVIAEESSVGGEQVARIQGINNLGLNQGVINMQTAGQVVQAGTLSGEGGTINAAARVAEDGTVETAQIQINQIAEDNAPHITANLTGVTADDVIKDTRALDNVVKTGVAGNETAASGAGGGTVTYTTKAAEGDVVGELTKTATLDEAGNVIADSSVKEAKNTVTAGLQKIAAMNYLTFRAQTNDVSKRMGDLRSMPQSDGAWGRIVAGQSEYKSIHNTYQTLQIGADKRIGNYYLGATASYTDGDGSLKNGSTDDKNYGLGLYGGWMGEDGQYVDVIVKRQKLTFTTSPAKRPAAAMTPGAPAHPSNTAGGWVLPTPGTMLSPRQNSCSAT